jgi:glycosyltransferase involved in cell wall biosynthesis
MRRVARAIDAENLLDHGYRTVRVGMSMPVVSNGSVSRVTVGPRVKPQVAEALEGMDVVHAQGMAPPTLCLWALRTSRAPVTVGTFHTYFEGGHWGYKYFFAYVRSTIARADRLIAVSDACVTALRPYFDRDFEIIPNGVDTDLYHPLPAGTPRPPGPARILFVGRFDPRNELDTMLEALRILVEQGRDVVLQVVGDGPLRPRYHHQARSLGVWERVEWLGLLDKERPRLYREATVFAAPCVLASFGVVLLEALASGTPIVCADNVGFRQVIRDGAPGRFVPPRDATALAAGIGGLLDDARTRADWAERGRRVAVERYSWPQVARQVEAVYLDVLARKGGRAQLLPPVGLRYNLRRNPVDLVRNIPAALRAGFPDRPEDDEAPRG